MTSDAWQDDDPGTPAAPAPLAGTPNALLDVVRDALDEAGVDHEPGSRVEEVVATLPGEKKLRTVVSLVCGEDALSVSAFVVRNPDENHADVYRFLLQRNLRLPGLAYAIDASGDVYLTGRVPAAGVDADVVDRLLGVVLTACDEPFNELLVLGFLSSMRTEWAWRVDRGESLRNLEAFRHILEREGDPPRAD
ncbi:YbjN domain-containing protein [Phycicoccus sp. BSK3Z-2]|uniref:YbjN domain-containing protein n=1 Tax=Phycicoccus avicenniae TaxID=2828860 RepID=A0A941D6Y4_9MICO|nr:YbjN domain-containing protein [Phycicoccus avicenniae]MBR7741915.1 YbjN domain-containing protein [Phycicoccus avicenniae]